MSSTKIPLTSIDYFYLTAFNLQRQLDPYQNGIGLRLLWLDDFSADLVFRKNNLTHKIMGLIRPFQDHSCVGVHYKHGENDELLVAIQNESITQSNWLKTLEGSR
jgi:hypothetical protein